MKTTEEQKLEFLDDILKYLANEKSENVVLQNIVTNVGYDKLNSSVFTHLPKFNLQTDQLNFFFSKAMKHLINEKLVDGLINGSEIYYTITFKGLLHIYGGGFIKPSNLKKEEYNFKKILWWIAIITFCINTLFQVLNFYFKDSRSTNVSKDVEHVCVYYNDTTSNLKSNTTSNKLGK